MELLSASSNLLCILCASVHLWLSHDSQWCYQPRSPRAGVADTCQWRCFRKSTHSSSCLLPPLPHEERCDKMRATGLRQPFSLVLPFYLIMPLLLQHRVKVPPSPRSWLWLGTQTPSSCLTPVSQPTSPACPPWPIEEARQDTQWVQNLSTRTRLLCSGHSLREYFFFFFV